MRFKAFFLSLLLLLVLTVPNLVSAQPFAPLPPPSEVTGNDPVAQKFGLSLGTLVSKALSSVFGIAGIIAFIWALIGVFQYITAGGNKEGLEKAKKRITWAFIGIIFLIISFSLSQYVRDLFQINQNQAVPGISNPNSR